MGIGTETENLKYSLLFNCIQEAILIAGLDRKITDCNPAFTELFGYPLEELAGKTPAFMYQNTDDYYYIGELLNSDCGKKGFTHHLSLKKKDGTVFPADIKVFYFIGLSGTAEGYGVSVRDVTERKKAEEALKEKLRAEAEFKHLFREHKAVKLLIDPADGTIIDANESAQQFYGYAADKLIGMNIAGINILPPAEIRQEMDKALNLKRVFFEFKHMTADGSVKDVEVYSNKVSFNGKDILHSIIHDVTQKKAAQREVEELRGKMIESLTRAKEEAEKNERLKTEFTGQVSHELRNPVHIILSCGKMLDEECNGCEKKQRWYLSALKSAGMRLNRMVGLILNSLQMNEGNYEPHFEHIDLDEMIRELLEEFTVTASLKELTLNYTGEEINVFADRFTLSQMLANLIENAVKYTDKGTVAVGIQKGDDGKTIISVKDTGVGISEEFLPFIFDRFRRENRAGKANGSGLGLHLVKKYCALNNALIEVTSKKHLGTEFRVII